jgi:HNH endonuclease
MPEVSRFFGIIITLYFHHPTSTSVTASRKRS